MRNILKYLSVVFGCALLAAACTDTKHEDILPPGIDDPDSYPEYLQLISGSEVITVSEDGLTATGNFRSTGGQAEIMIESDQPGWKIDKSGAGDWVQITEKEAGFIVGIPTNEDNRRSSSVKVTIGEGRNQITATVEINQLAAGGSDIMVDQPFVMLTSGGQLPVVVNVTTDSDQWNFDMEICEWLLVEKADNTLTFTADPNPSATIRSAEVNVRAKEGAEPTTIFVKQDEKSVISVSRSAFVYVDDGGTGSFNVTTNQESWEYTVEGGEGWLDVQRNGNTINVTVANGYTDIDDRVANIHLKTGKLDDIIAHTVVITQRGSDPYKMLIKVDATTTNDVMVPISGEIHAVVDWGDGTIEDVEMEYAPHRYANAGTYYITISGEVELLCTDGLGLHQRNAIHNIIKWGRLNVKSMKNALASCQNIRTLPANTDDFFSEVEDFTGAFTGTQIATIPGGLFANCPKATTFDQVFKEVKTLTEIPEDLFSGCTEAKSFYQTFQNCTGIGEIPEKLFQNNTKAESMNRTFYGMTKITSIPEKIFEKNVNVKDFSFVFGSCNNVAMTTIPENLFRYNVNAENFEGVFYNCNKLTAVPEKLFETCTKAKSFAQAFYNCSAITSVGKLFEKCVDVESFSQTFSTCTNLATVAPGIFAGCTKVTTVYDLFYSCSKLTSIPEGLLINSPNITTYERAFRGCAALVNIPERLINCTSAENLNFLFYGCTNLTTIPSDLFNNCGKATTMQQMFYNCQKLSAIPDGLFDHAVELMLVGYTFYNCKGLTSVPVNLFDNSRKIYSWGYLFYGCSNVTSESPYTMIDVDGTATKVHIYERENYKDHFPVLFTISKNYVFRSATKFSDYASIPSAWK